MRGLKQYIIMVLQLIIAVVVTNELKAQNYCVSGNCNPNIYAYSLDPNTIEYDNMISVFHSSMIREADGTVKVWGQGVAQNGNGTNGNVLTTTDPAGELSGANFGSGSNQLTGTVLKFAGASSSNNQQFAVLSTNGLYVWGNAGILVPNVSNVSNGSFRKVAIGTYNVSGGATKADGLPDGVNPADVKMMFGTREGLAIVTCTGAAWVLTINGSAYGDGATDNATNDLLWHRVSTAANTPLNNVVAVRGTFQTFMALTASGDIYTWGTGTRINNGSGAQNLSFATLITKPSGVTPKMIGMTQSTGGKTYYLLATDGRLFSMGENNQQQLGYGGTTDANVWGQVTTSTTVAGETYTIGSNVVWISPQEHDGGTQIQNNASINVITTQGKVWAWGNNSYGMLGYPTGTQTSPPGVMPGRTTGAYDNTKLNMSDIIMAVETGGHTTLLIKQCSKKFGYVGHRIRGSMADGTNTDGQEVIYNFGQTADVTICGAPTSPAVQNLDVCPTAKANLNNAILSSPPTGFYLEWWTTSNRQANTKLSDTDIIAVGPGTYYAFYIADTGPCETPAYSSVIVTDNKPGCLIAEDDTYGSYNGYEGGTTNSVLDNDTFLDLPINQSDINLTPGSPSYAGLVMNPDGTITVPLGTPAGIYTYPYTICLQVRPTYCDDATATITVVAPDIDAIDDTYGPYNGADGGTTGSVLVNDYLNGGLLDPADVNLTPGTPSDPSLLMNPDGTITVPAGTPAGTYTYPYTICEKLNLANCDDATATITVVAPEIDAIDDNYSPYNGADGGTTPSVLVNDVLNGSPVDPADVNLTPGTPSDPSLSMNPDGTITVPAGTPAGTYTYPYTICEKLNLANCDDATATITVVAPEIDAIDDNYSPYNGADGGTTPSVLVNDVLNGSPVDPADVNLTPGTPSNPSLVMNPDGTITVPAGTPAGTYTYPYTICEKLNPTNCDDATATITVVAPDIDAIDDTYGPYNGADGGTTGSVLVNDYLNGGLLDPADVNLTPGTPSDPSLSMNPDGTITVPAGTPAGTYTYPYTICEKLNPTNCDDATATITVVAPDIDAIDDTYSPYNGADGGTTPSVLVNDVLNGSPVDPAEVTLTPGTPSDPSLTMNPDGTVEVAPGTPAGTYTYPYTICEIVNPTNCDAATVTIVVGAPEIVALDDNFGGINGADGGTTPSVLDNDELNGNPVNPSEVTLTPGTPSDPSLTMNPDGTVEVVPGTPAGTYTYPYTICEIVNPTNCDAATVTIVVGAPEIVAVDDNFGGINGADGGTTPSVLDNDELNGNPVNPAEVTLTPGTPSDPSLTMNPDGTVEVAPGTPAGTYTYPYTICEVVNPTNCDAATVTIVVGAPEIVAVDDNFGGINGADGGTTPSVLDNDELNGNPVNPSEVTLTPGTPSDPSLTMNPDGTVEVAPGTPAGTYTYPYTICEVVNPTNCDAATVTIVVGAPEIVALDDNFGGINGADGGTTPSVLDNDELNGNPVNPSEVTLTPGTPSDPSLTMNPDGTVEVAPGTPAGTYTYPYTICEIVNPTNCDAATVTIVVGAPEIVAVDDNFGGINGADGGTTPSVLDNDELNGNPVNPAEVTLTPGTPSDPSLTMNPDGTVEVAPGTPAGTYTYPYTICEVVNPTNCDAATATIVVGAPEIVAVDDNFGGINGADGGTTPSVLDNDELNGNPVNPSEVTLTPGTPSDPSLTMNPDGTVEVAPGTPAGTYTYPYTICEVVNPTNCDAATATIVVTGIITGCVNPNIKVLLEGPFSDKGDGSTMTTKLNSLGYLPGQNPVTFFGIPTPVGQPYNMSPWNYAGAEGTNYDKNLHGPKAGYATDITDWVLLSLRETTAPSSSVCKKAALLHSNGTVEMVSGGFDCCDIDIHKQYYIVVEHRNHLIVMSNEKISVVNNTVSYDFTSQQSFRGLLGYGQKVIDGKFVMYAGNSDQVQTLSSIKDVNAKDKDLWLLHNGENSQYNINDYELNGDVNVQDKNMWLDNNSIFTDVPR